MKLLHVLILFAVAGVNSKAVERKGRIIRGNSANVGQFPDVALLEAQYTCGGVLIAEEWVLTAAQCVHDAHTVNVYLGVTLIEEAKVAYTVSANNIIIHPFWNLLSNVNDIALVKIPFTEKCFDIFPAALPDETFTYEDQIATATGWGLIDENGVPYAHQLQWTQVNVISNLVCSSYYDEVTPDKLCGVVPFGVSASQGDGGSPLLLGGEVIGIASVCSTSTFLSGEPVVFTRITEFLPWIRDLTGLSP